MKVTIYLKKNSYDFNSKKIYYLYNSSNNYVNSHVGIMGHETDDAQGRVKGRVFDSALHAMWRTRTDDF